ncbi:DUF7255 family protein [Sediminitomix flava]|uniref:Uncharacterized protein n=1 Tax=Sediminitomix flava TaxID=379075 RepID=A0A315ZB17_SEDFL|nr:hypothetical protein [Sediminitomix flava]PWJ42741.1 hypothetical protein BC781_102286 [Sediminitomix flava]
MNTLTIREYNFKELILDNFKQTHPQKIFKWADFEESKFKEEIFNTYHKLTGQKNNPNIKLSPWLIEIEDVVIVLDEILHFNRYRGITLRSEIYNNLPSFPLSQYTRYCNQKENECLKPGGSLNNWSNQFAEIQFGPSSQRVGDFKGLGSSAWKLRAFKDYLQDISSLMTKDYKVLRISVWDQIMNSGQLHSYNDLLLNPSEADKELIIKNIQRRIKTITS